MGVIFFLTLADSVPLILMGKSIQREAMISPVLSFLSLLTDCPPFEGVFNPWADVDRENDVGPYCPEIRRRHLGRYLECRIGKAFYLLVGEAVGYQGGHFSGIPMTSERILLGFHGSRGIRAEHVLPGLEPQRTSKPEKMPRGFSEPTATIVWEAVLRSGCKPTEFVFWNAFPWHPFNPKRGILSNRKPKQKEMVYGTEAVMNFLELFPGAIVIAVGKVSAQWFDSSKVDHYSVRHPAQGGARQFRNQLFEVMERTKNP